ncbi:carboxypeptidase-like regulatory domain-containing protein [bacterium]|nr:carboxypeptidase-like regulatory domain-containing protein [bacterium]
MKKLTVPLLLLFSTALAAQHIAEGVIYDMETGKPLPYANIQIVGTYKGTISNDNGRFRLPLETLPAELLIRYIGYESRTVEVTPSSLRLDIAMVPTPVELREVVVTAEDPAVGIMRKVIENKQRWRALITTYRASAYTRAALKNDTSIVSISESTSEVYWHRDRGSREVVTSRQETSNISSDNNFAFAGQIPNLYDDDIDLMEFDIVGPTHPKALNYYRFSIIGQRRIDDKTVVDIAIAPKNKLQPTFVGRISILLDDYALIDIDVTPNRAMLFPPPIQELNLHFRQQYSNFGGDFWLPVDMRIQGGIKIGFTGLQFPTMHYSQISRLTDYEINVPMPDSLYAFGDAIQIDSLSTAADTLRADTTPRIPLTPEEEKAYATLDSTMTLEKAFRPTGFLAKMARLDVEREGSSDGNGGDGPDAFSMFSLFRPELLYNRVDGLRAGISIARDIPGNLSVRLMSAYSSGLKRWAWKGELSYNRDRSRGFRAGITWSRGSETVQRSLNYPRLFNSLNFLCGQPDYFDYYWSEAWNLTVGYAFRLKTQVHLEAGLRRERGESLSKTTEWTLFDNDRLHRENPAIDEGTTSGLTAAVTLGDGFAPWGFIGFNRMRVEVEYAHPDLMGSDAAFTSWNLVLDGRIPTFLPRRFLPNVIDFRIIGGTVTGDPPLQRLGSMDARLGIFTPYGTFRAIRHRPVTGRSYAGMFWEHNFRTVPFEILGLRKLAEKGVSLLIHGASGRTWIPEEDLARFDWNGLNGWHHEIGVSLSGLFDLFRIDCTWPLSGNGVYFGLSGSRMF